MRRRSLRVAVVVPAECPSLLSVLSATHHVMLLQVTMLSFARPFAYYIVTVLCPSGQSSGRVAAEFARTGTQNKTVTGKELDPLWRGKQ